MCAMHALNMAVGGPVLDEAKLQAAAQLVVDESLAAALDSGAQSTDRLSMHAGPGGWYSDEALAAALRMDGRWELDQTPLLQQRGGIAALSEPSVVGALVYTPGHWRALRILNGDVWLFDSLQRGPRRLGSADGAEWREFAETIPRAFLLRAKAALIGAPALIQHLLGAPSLIQHPNALTHRAHFGAHHGRLELGPRRSMPKQVGVPIC